LSYKALILWLNCKSSNPSNTQNDLWDTKKLSNYFCDFPLADRKMQINCSCPSISCSLHLFPLLILSHKDRARNARIRSEMQLGPISFHLARIIYAKLSIEICLDKMQTDGEN